MTGAAGISTLEKYYDRVDEHDEARIRQVQAITAGTPVVRNSTLFWEGNDSNSHFVPLADEYNRFAVRQGVTSPPFSEVDLKHGDRLDHPAFPVVYRAGG